MMKLLENFSKAEKTEKLRLIDQLYEEENISQELSRFHIEDKRYQEIIDQISENVISNYHLPYSVAPNFLINNEIYHIPMVTEESSVVAAASSAAKFWRTQGGFYSKVISVLKSGQIHFIWKGSYQLVSPYLQELYKQLDSSVASTIFQMQSRGGGIKKITWQDGTSALDSYHSIHVSFNTMDAMGANFINTCLETMAGTLNNFLEQKFPDVLPPTIVMSILSNHVPECLVTCEVECPIENLSSISGNLSPEEFATKFELAIKIANINTYRAVTHNKGIFNGVDAVALATGNDFRAIEAGGHAYATIDGIYKSLSDIELSKHRFYYKITLPMAVGTVGGLVSVHPLAKLSMKILGNPSAPELMEIMAATGMANNFSAIRALITSGIQQGHMKLHLFNILNQLDASAEEKQQIIEYFQNEKVSFSGVKAYLTNIRQYS